jgi:hydrogenase maturation factor
MTGSPFTLASGASTRKSFPGIDAGPVKIVSTQNIVAAERLIYRVKGVNTSFTEMMALPNRQLSTTYWLPWYNNVSLDTQLRLANLGPSTATVHIYIGGQEVMGSPFTLASGASTRRSFPGIDRGPVQIVSNQNIVAAERVIYKVNVINTSFSEMMGLPQSLLGSTYWLPWYNNADLDTQLRFGVP